MTIEWKPTCSGQYHIVVSRLGVPFPGSPFNPIANDPEPSAAQCVVRGEALTHAVSREMNKFELEFKDKLGAQEWQRVKANFKCHQPQIQAICQLMWPVSKNEYEPIHPKELRTEFLIPDEEAQEFEHSDVLSDEQFRAAITRIPAAIQRLFQAYSKQFKRRVDELRRNRRATDDSDPDSDDDEDVEHAVVAGLTVPRKGKTKRGASGGAKQTPAKRTRRLNANAAVGETPRRLR